MEIKIARPAKSEPLYHVSSILYMQCVHRMGTGLQCTSIYLLILVLYRLFTSLLPYLLL